MAEWSGNSKVVLSHRSHGRNVGNNHTFLESVGNFAVNFPVGIRLSDAQWKQNVKQIVKAFDELPMNGITYDWISDQLRDSIYPDSKLTPEQIISVIAVFPLPTYLSLSSQTGIVGCPLPIKNAQHY
jgi:hypothetical protein